MFKKIIIILLLIFSFWWSVFAKYNPKHNVKNDTQKQDYLKKEIAKWWKIDYNAIRNKLDDQSLTDEFIEKKLNDWLEWDITRAAKAVYDQKIEEEIAKTWINPDSWKKESNTNNWDGWAIGWIENMKCSYDGEWNVMDAMTKCVNWDTANWWKLSLVGAGDDKDLQVWAWFKDQVIEWTKKIAWFLGVWAIFAIAFGSLKLTLSRWEEEQIKKWKDIIKWWVLWFLLVVSGGFIVWIIVNIIYGLLW